jgi:hypothetical protein
MAPEDFARARPHPVEMGQVAGDELERLAAEADQNSPVLRGYDERGQRIDEIVCHPAYGEMERLAFSRFGLAAMAHRDGVLGWPGPVPHVVKYALSCLFAQSEFGLLCPVNMTDSAARTLRRHGSAELQARYLPHLTATDLDDLWQGVQWMTERTGGSDVGASTAVRFVNLMFRAFSPEINQAAPLAHSGPGVVSQFASVPGSTVESVGPAGGSLPGTVASAAYRSEGTAELMARSPGAHRPATWRVPRREPPAGPADSLARPAHPRYRRARRAAVRRSRKCLVAPAGSGAAHTAEITATASAPAAMTSAALSRVMPPIPTSGTGRCGRSALTSSGPTSWNPSLVPVGKMLPTAT